ncbi:MAG TPA: hypothetical protein VHV51_24280, partial [Polyangiaceae bacterium]|nr:hypothetical protein [Polyangiaceae bacterium]
GFTFGVGQCPEPAAVEREVLRLIPAERHALVERDVRIELDDLGDSYRVTVSNAGTSLKKSYADPARDCDSRARFAAVFAVLTVMPPELGPEPPKPKPPPPPPVRTSIPLAPSPPRAPPAPPPLARIELGAQVVYAPPIVSAPELSAPGAELRVALGRGLLAGTLSFGYTARSQFVLDGVHGEITTLPASAGVRLSSELAALRVSTDLDLLALTELVHATGLASTRTSRALELGARAGVVLSYPAGRGIAPFIGAFAWVVPAPRELSALPSGTIGNLPYLRLGGSAGIALGF